MRLCISNKTEEENDNSTKKPTTNYSIQRIENKINQSFLVGSVNVLAGHVKNITPSQQKISPYIKPYTF